MSWMVFGLLSAKNRPKQAQRTKRIKGVVRGVLNEKVVFLNESRTTRTKTDP